LPSGRRRSRNAQRLPSIRSVGIRPPAPDDSSEPGASRRSTSAPQAARKRVPVGPATTRVQSRTLIPARGGPRVGSHELPSAATASTCTIGSACTALPAGWVNHSAIVRLSATVGFASTSFCSISSRTFPPGGCDLGEVTLVPGTRRAALGGNAPDTKPPVVRFESVNHGPRPRRSLAAATPLALTRQRLRRA
jgi:hypothetical protein